MADMTSIVWGGVPAPVTFGFQAPSGNCGLYGYGANYCLPGCNHTGIDIGLAFGTTLYAVSAGEITCAGTGVGPGAEGIGCGAFNCVDATGNICGAGRVELLLDDGTIAIYGHCSAALVSVGQRVRRGDPIARSGEQNGPHLHFEQRVPNSVCAAGYAIVDPEPLLTQSGVPSPGFVVGDTLAVEASDGLNLREGPGLSFGIITTMPWNRKAIVVSGPTLANGYH
jgi:murein DD-endopeptidase MepM/ murein hydrolase activator NlpD